MPVVAPDPPLAAGGVVLRVPDDGDAAWITKSWNDPDIARFIVGMPGRRDNVMFSLLPADLG